MPRFNAEQLGKAESLGRELSASASFADDDEWHEYQESVATALAKPPLPARGDSQRRPVWGAIAKAHKKMIAQLDADRAAALIVSRASGEANASGSRKRRADAPPQPGGAASSLASTVVAPLSTSSMFASSAIAAPPLPPQPPP